MSQVASTVFSDVQTEFYDSGFDYILDNSQTDRAKRWINQSYQELCGLEKWPFLRVSTTGTSPVSISAYNRIGYVRDTTTNVKLLEIDEDTLTEDNPDLTVTGCASWYYTSYDAGVPTINVFPVTTNTLQIVYYQNPTPLDADADVLVVPDQFIDIVVLGAMRRAYLDGTDTAAQINNVKAEWRDRVEFMRSQLLPRPTYQYVSQFPFGSEDW